MSDVNTVIVTGVVVRDPYVAQTKNGKIMMKFTMKASRDFAYNNEQKTSTVYVNVLVYGNAATQFERVLKDGSRIMLQGRLATSFKKDGERTIYETIVEASELMLLDAVSAPAQPQHTSSYRARNTADPFAAPRPSPEYEDAAPRQAPQAVSPEVAQEVDEMVKDAPF